MIRLALLALSLSACASYAGIAIAPNGTIWVATNNTFGGPYTEGMYACTPRAGELSCSRVPVRGIGQ